MVSAAVNRGNMPTEGELSAFEAFTQGAVEELNAPQDRASLERRAVEYRRDLVEEFKKAGLGRRDIEEGIGMRFVDGVEMRVEDVLETEPVLNVDEANLAAPCSTRNVAGEPVCMAHTDDEHDAIDERESVKRLDQGRD